MRLIVQKTKFLKGHVSVPASKSQTIRGLILALLARGKSTLINPLMSEDTKTAIEVCKNLGAKIKINGSKLTVDNQRLKNKTGIINTGNSGITTRFILPILGLRENFQEPVILDCGKQMKQRPIKPLVDALNKLGMKIEYAQKKGRLPLKISGRLIGGNAAVDGATSQYVSALLMSLPCAGKNSLITVNKLNEKPYVKMTLQWLKEQGIKYRHINHGISEGFKIQGKQNFKAFNKIIPGDFSSASYFLAAGVMLPCKITISGLDMQDAQGDKKMVEILKKMGAKIIIKKNQIIIVGGKILKGIKIDANEIPDLVPTLAVLGAKAKGKTEILNVPQARIKETDRLRSMYLGLKKMGANITELKDGLIVKQSQLKGVKLQGFKDHRTIMALTIAGMLAQGKTSISTAENINKTFPEFIKLMRSLGASVWMKNI